MEKRFVLLGIPGVGKGTQAQKLYTKTQIPLIVMGDILRDTIASKSPLGRQAEQYMNQGSLVPDALVIQIVLSRIRQNDCIQSGFLLDGFPRNCEQAEALDKEMVSQKKKVDCALYYAVSDEAAMERMLGRLICKKCKAIYHLKNNPPKQAGICDICSEKLSQRRDDTPEVIRKRLDVYRQETLPLIEYYRKKKSLLEIQSDRSMEEIFQDTLAKLKIA
jgi:adenylate kinase